MSLSQLLPAEIISHICSILSSQSDLSTLSTLLLLSHDTHHLASQHLYHHLHLTPVTIPSLLLGIPKPASSSSRRVHRDPRLGERPSWSEFVSRDFYLEWAGRIDWGHNETLRAPVQYLVWPDIELESGDDDGANEEIQVAFEGFAYPIRASTARKVHQLSWTRHLHLDVLPSSRDCEHLAILTKTQGRLFPTLLTVSISASAFFELLDFHSAHLGRPHPITPFLRSLRPTRVCITHPTADKSLEKRFMLPRLVTHDEHACRRAEQDQFTFLRLNLRDLLASGHFTDHLRSYWPGAKVTVHDAKRYFRQGVRTEHCRCACADVTADWDERFCYDHYTNEAVLHDVFGLYVAPMREGETTEIGGLGRFVGRESWSEVMRTKWDAGGRERRETWEEVKGKVSLVKLGDICPCCKQRPSL